MQAGLDVAGGDAKLAGARLSAVAGDDLGACLEVGDDTAALGGGDGMETAHGNSQSEARTSPRPLSMKP